MTPPKKSARELAEELRAHLASGKPVIITSEMCGWIVSDLERAAEVEERELKTVTLSIERAQRIRDLEEGMSAQGDTVIALREKLASLEAQLAAHAEALRACMCENCTRQVPELGALGDQKPDAARLLRSQLAAAQMKVRAMLHGHINERGDLLCELDAVNANWSECQKALAAAQERLQTVDRWIEHCRGRHDATIADCLVDWLDEPETVDELIEGSE